MEEEAEAEEAPKEVELTTGESDSVYSTADSDTPSKDDASSVTSSSPDSAHISSSVAAVESTDHCTQEGDDPPPKPPRSEY